MRRLFRSFALPPSAFLLLCLASTAWAAAAEKDSSYNAAIASIKASGLGENVDRLAGPAMEGREAGTPGGKAAGDYLADRYASLHLRGRATTTASSNRLSPTSATSWLCSAEAIQNWGLRHHRLRPLRSSRLWLRQPSLGPAGSLHPGADDNASGTSAVLELAKAFARLPRPPKHRSCSRIGMPKKRACLARRIGSAIRRFRWIALWPAEPRHDRAAARQPCDRYRFADRVWMEAVGVQPQRRPGLRDRVHLAAEAERRSLPAVRARDSRAVGSHGPAQRLSPAERRAAVDQP